MLLDFVASGSSQRLFYEIAIRRFDGCVGVFPSTSRKRGVLVDELWICSLSDLTLKMTWTANLILTLSLESTGVESASKGSS